MTSTALFGLVFGPVLLAAVLSLVADMLSQRSAGRIGAAVLLTAAGATALIGGMPLKPALVYDAFMVGGGYSTVTGVALVLAALALLASDDRVGSVPALVSLSVGGAALAGSSADLVALLVALEISAMCGYALVSAARTRRADEASMKYFVQGAVATGLFVLGLGVLVGGTGGTTFLAAAGRAFGLLGAGQPVLLGAMAVVAALSFKSGVAPFHSWAPDAYENAPAPVSGFLSGAVKLGMITALTIFTSSMVQSGISQDRPFGLIGREMMMVMGALAVLSVLIGSTVALRTTSYTRMLGYAGVAQVGYALIAVASLRPSLALVFATTYAIGTSGAFAAAEVLRRRRPGWDGTIAGMAGLGKEEPLTAAALTMLLMSLAGIPPLVGFWGKLQAFGAALSGASKLVGTEFTGLGLWLALLAVVGILGSVVSLGYYGSVIRALYFDAPLVGAWPATGGRGESVGVARWVVVILAVLALVLGLLPMILGVSTTLNGFLLG